MIRLRLGLVGLLLPRPELSHIEVLPACRPLLMLLGQHGSNQSPGRVDVGDDVEHLFYSPDLLN